MATKKTVKKAVVKKTVKKTTTAVVKVPVKKAVKKAAVKKAPASGKKSSPADAFETAMAKVKPLKPVKTGKLAPHIVVKARAGTGKTTTAVQCLNLMTGGNPSIVPSPQQKAIWDAVMLESAGKIRFAAFSRAIADELQHRLPSTVDANTLHSFGRRMLVDYDPQRRIPRSVKLEKPFWHVVNWMEEKSGMDLKTMQKEKFPINAIAKLASLCKQNLVDWRDDGFEDAVDDLVAHFGIEFEDSIEEVAQHVAEYLDYCITPKKGKYGDWFPTITYDDMIWMPLVLDGIDFAKAKCDLMFVDECQDLNKCQYQLAKRMADRMVFIGDPLQAIFGFAGADATSFENITADLASSERGMIELPLTETRRCGKAIVEFVHQRELCDDLTAHKSNVPGEVVTDFSGDLFESVEPKDFVLCRINAPLVSMCFKLLKAKRKARIQGRDIGDDLIALIKRFKCDLVEDLIPALEEWESEQCLKYMKRKDGESLVAALQDKVDCIRILSDEFDRTDDLVAFFKLMFSDGDTDNPADMPVVLSSMHRSKGLEADTVWIIHPEKIPHPMAKQDWEMVQERNLEYVAYTRAIHKLVIVR